jgi:hypothetical protein
MAREALIRRGFAPGLEAKHETQKLHHATLLFQEQMGLALSGRLDRGTLAALGIAEDSRPELMANAVPMLTKEDRQDLEKADQEMGAADWALKAANLDRQETRDRIEQEIETARSLLRRENYHAGRERVMQAHFELDLARNALEEKRNAEARFHLVHSRENLEKALASTSEVIEVPFVREGEREYRYARPAGEVHAQVEVQNEEWSGITKSKGEKNCSACDNITDSDEWMKDAVHAVVGAP